MREDIRELINEIKGVAQLSEAEEQLLQDVLQDAAGLAAKALNGEDVSSELAILKATTLNVAAAKRAIIQNRVEAFFLKLVKAVVDGLL